MSTDPFCAELSYQDLPGQPQFLRQWIHGSFGVTLLSLQPVVPVLALLLFGQAHLFPWLWAKLKCQPKGIFQQFWSSVQLHTQLCQQHGERGGRGLPQPLEVKPQRPWLN